jgi:ribosome-binding factor A
VTATAKKPANARTGQGKWMMAKTGYSRADRVADQIRMEVADILMRKIKDPRVRSVTVTDVELTNDLRIARVFVTALGTDAETRDVFAGLAKASGFVRSELGRRLTLRYLPEVVFVKDVSGPRGDRILQLLDEIHVKADEPADAPRDSDDSSRRDSR